MRTSTRVIIKKVTALNLFADQATQIQAIMEATGAQEVAPLVRELLDEALAARRRKIVHREETEQPPPTQEIPETLQTIQTPLLRMIGQDEITYRIQCANLELIQEALVEARAARVESWEYLSVPALHEKGRSREQIGRLFELQTEDAQDYSYGLAEEIRDKIVGKEPASAGTAADDEDRQGRLTYENGHPTDPADEDDA
jgi:hypothetical protein